MATALAPRQAAAHATPASLATRAILALRVCSLFCVCVCFIAFVHVFVFGLQIILTILLALLVIQRQHAAARARAHQQAPAPATAASQAATAALAQVCSCLSVAFARAFFDVLFGVCVLQMAAHFQAAVHPTLVTRRPHATATEAARRPPHAPARLTSLAARATLAQQVCTCFVLSVCLSGVSHRLFLVSFLFVLPRIQHVQWSGHLRF